MPIEFDLPVGDDPEAAALAATLTEIGNERFLRAVAGAPVEFHHRSTEGQVEFSGRVRDEYRQRTSSLLLRAAHLCFTAHLPLSLSPDVLWYALVHEVATHVRLHADRYPAVFGPAPAAPGERSLIEVRDDFAPEDWERSIGLVEAPLREVLGAEVVELFRPEFSTTTRADAAAVLVALMDVVSPFHRFRWITLCGIPRIRLTGTAADWRLLADRAGELGERFDGLREWTAALGPVLEEIAGTAAGQPVDREFWSSFYKWHAGSGGDRVTGWVNAFFAHRYTDEGPSPKQEFGPGGTLDELFPAHVSRVPFEWQTPAGTFPMVFLGGVLGIERDGEWIVPRLGQAVARVLPDDEPGNELLPEGWTLTDLRRLSGDDRPSLFEPTGTVDLAGAPVRARLVVDVDEVYLVQTEDGLWYKGGPGAREGDVECWSPGFEDPGAAFRY
ncbi:DUF4419 domain-containing protein [Kitasatospora sp. NPDC096147]|uniref:DUF4419 domain-containing protein n=1 Tax=Kitasatospora sp. NPDC096147 TaxID=3364093 RepID=UPI00383010F8